jgi:hypothetical protein
LKRARQRNNDDDRYKEGRQEQQPLQPQKPSSKKRSDREATTSDRKKSKRGVQSDVPRNQQPITNADVLHRVGSEPVASACSSNVPVDDLIDEALARGRSGALYCQLMI